jgi:multiple sugar transport system permease protein
VWAFLALFPIYWLLKNSIEPNQLLAVWPPHVLPRWEKWTLLNYSKLFHRFPIPRWFFNSALVTVLRTSGAVILGSMAGYAFAKLRFWGREVIFWALMSVIMIPSFITIVPSYQVIVWLGWKDTYWALIIPGLTGGIGAMFLMRQFLRSLPTELIESARIDGASEWTIYWRLILPLAKPGLAVLGIFWFMGNWNNFLWPFIVSFSKDMFTLPVGLALLTSPKDTGQIAEVGQQLAGASISAIPMIIVFLVFQRYFLKGITVGALKG